MGEITLPSMHIPKKPDEQGNISISFKTPEDDTKTKKRRDKESERSAVEEIWDKAKESDVDDKAVIFEKVIDNPKTSADVSFFRREPLRTFIDQDMRVWLANRAEGGFTYKATICNMNGKYLREYPPKFYHFDTDGDMYLEEQDEKESKFGSVRGKKGRGFVNESLIVGGGSGSDIEPQEMLRTISQAVDKGIEVAKKDGNNNQDTVNSIIEIAKVLKAEPPAKQDNTGIITAILSIVPAVMEKFKPVEKNDDKIYTMMMEMQKGTNDMMRELQRGNVDAVNKLSDMMAKNNEMLSKEIAKTKEDMLALINTKNNPAFNIAEIITPIIETNKLTNALQMQAFGGLTQMLKMVVEMKDLSKQENEETEEKPMAAMIMDSASGLLRTGVECFKAMSVGMPKAAQGELVSQKTKTESGEKVETHEDGVDINEIIGDILEGVEASKNPIEIADRIIGTYEKQDLAEILGQNPDQLISKVSAENLVALGTHSAVVNQVVEEIKKKLEA